LARRRTHEWWLAAAEMGRRWAPPARELAEAITSGAEAAGSVGDAGFRVSPGTGAIRHWTLALMRR
jgi:hypothetical protein